MKKVPSFGAAFSLIISSISVWLLSSSTQLSHAAQSDIDCLKAVRASLHDPLQYLASWDFTNGTQTDICKFAGIDCWHQDDNSVLNIRLSGMLLEGEFPLGVVNCTLMTGLDLSINNLSGPIPKNISHLIASVTTLDLSSNQFSGQIPANLANCSFLNTLELNNNTLTGPIPPQILKITRLKTFDVSNNHLNGSITANPNNISFIYANNSGLCGGTPLPVIPAAPSSLLAAGSIHLLLPSPSNESFEQLNLLSPFFWRSKLLETDILEGGKISHGCKETYLSRCKS